MINTIIKIKNNNIFDFYYFDILIIYNLQFINYKIEATKANTTHIVIFKITIIIYNYTQQTIFLY